MPDAIDRKLARRLALVAAGLYRPRWNGLPTRALGAGHRARRAALEIVRHFGYLQLDTISIAGARSHSLVLMSRLRGLAPELPETLLRPRQPLFEYWGHEASWLPIELYPHFAFRRQQFRTHPWWGDLLRRERSLADRIKERIRNEGPLRSLDLEGQRREGMWNLKLARRVADALWSCGELAIRERRNFQILYDLAENVVPQETLERRVDLPEALRCLLLRALTGHGWATTGTLARTWRLRNMRSEVQIALEELRESGDVVPCTLALGAGRTRPGWIRPRDLESCARLTTAPRAERAVLLSPFDPMLWDRQRIQELFGFHQVLEIYKPAADRIYGYYCLPILVGEKLIGRCDLKARRGDRRLEIRRLEYEEQATPRHEELARAALQSYAESLGLRLIEPSG